jgi:hypothetical protein
VQVDFTATVINNVLVGTIIPNNAALLYTSRQAEWNLGNPTGSETPGDTGTTTGERGGSIRSCCRTITPTPPVQTST